MYVLKRVAAFAAILIGLELLVSGAWLLLHGAERRTLSELGPRIEELGASVRAEREWLTARTELGRSLDALEERLERGPDAFPSRSAYDSARTLHADRVESWNTGLSRHRERGSRLDSLARLHDRLAAEWNAAYRRAYPGWLLLPRPEPPRGAGARGDEGEEP